MVVASTRPELVGADVSGLEDFAGAAEARNNRGMFVAAPTRGLATGRWPMTAIRSLNARDGGFAGVLAMAYDTSSLLRFFREADLGDGGMVALVGLRDGRLRGLAGPPASPGLDVSGTAMMTALRADPGGRWTGPSAPDGVRRVHAFRPVPDRDLVVIVASEARIVESGLGGLAGLAWLHAGGTTGFVLIGTIFLLRGMRAARPGEPAPGRERAAFARTPGELEMPRFRREVALAALECEGVNTWPDVAGCVPRPPQPAFRAMGESNRPPGRDIGRTLKQGPGLVASATRANTSEAAAAGAPEALPAGLPRTRVLVVEDVLVNQLVTATLLRREGHMVDVAATGDAAVRMATTGCYDIVFMDVLMPGITGLEASRRIRDLPPPAGSVPVLALTACLAAEERDAARRAGMDELVAKPVVVKTLLDAIARHVWGRRTQGASQFVAQPPAGAPTLSEHRIAALRQDLRVPKLLALAEDCVAELRARLAELQHALAVDDANEVRTHAHAMAGLASGYGMAALDQRLRALMAAAAAGSLPLAGAQGAELSAELDRAASALRATLSQALVDG